MKKSMVFFLISMLMFQINCAKQMHGSPETDGMIIVECRSISLTKDIPWDSDETVFLRPKTCWVVKLGESKGTSREIKTAGLDDRGLFVFSDLKPGTYHVIGLEGEETIFSEPSVPLNPINPTGIEHRLYYYQFPISDFPELHVTLVPGQIKLCGFITLSIKHVESMNGKTIDRADKNTHFSLYPLDEHSVLEKVYQAASDSPWAKEIYSKMNTYH